MSDPAGRPGTNRSPSLLSQPFFGRPRSTLAPLPSEGRIVIPILTHKGLFGRRKWRLLPHFQEAVADSLRPLRSTDKNRYDAVPLIRRIGFEIFMSEQSTATAGPPASFEAALSELESLVGELEGGQLPLADALRAYRRGAELLQYAQGQLQSAQEQVKILEGDLLKNFEPADNGTE